MTTPTMPELNSRQRMMWNIHDFSQGRGLEIGPLHSSIVPRGTADVHYLDVFDRPTLIKNYEPGGLVDTSVIPEIDYVLSEGDRVRSIVETIGDAPKFDWVMASHVVEHIPNLVGWLAQIAEIMNDHGKLVLCVPDRRYCFDHHRPATTIGQVIQAYDAADSIPSVRAVYDSARSHATADAAELWAGEHPGYERRENDLDYVAKLIERQRAGEYIDSHCWTFTPGTFVEQLTELRELGLSDWAFHDHRPTRRGQLEFHTVLRRLPREKPWDDALFANEPVLDDDLPDYIAEERDLKKQAKDDATLVREQALQIARLERRLARKEARLAETRAAMKQARRSARRANDRAANADERVAAVESSRRYKVGSVIARPADALRRRKG